MVQDVYLNLANHNLSTLHLTSGSAVNGAKHQHVHNRMGI